MICRKKPLTLFNNWFWDQVICSTWNCMAIFRNIIFVRYVFNKSPHILHKIILKFLPKISFCPPWSKMYFCNAYRWKNILHQENTWDLEKVFYYTFLNICQYFMLHLKKFLITHSILKYLLNFICNISVSNYYHLPNF